MNSDLLKNISIPIITFAVVILMVALVIPHQHQGSICVFTHHGNHSSHGCTHEQCLSLMDGNLDSSESNSQDDHGHKSANQKTEGNGFCISESSFIITNKDNHQRCRNVVCCCDGDHCHEMLPLAICFLSLPEPDQKPSGGYLRREEALVYKSAELPSDNALRAPPFGLLG